MTTEKLSGAVKASKKNVKKDGWLELAAKLSTKVDQEFGRLVKKAKAFCELTKKKAAFGAFTIKGSRRFKRRVRATLNKLYATRTGRELMEGIAQTGHGVVIEETKDQNGYCRADDGAKAKTPGVGTGSTIQWNPSHDITGPGDKPGSTVILGHELVHAYHNARGTNANGPYDTYPGQNGASARGEERSTVGAAGTSITDPLGNAVSVPDYSGSFPTENSLRDDLGISRRKTYYPSNWTPAPPW